MTMRGFATSYGAVFVLLALALMHLSLGAAPIGATAIWAALFDFDPTNYEHVVIVYQRLSRLVVAIYCGGVLGVAGLLLQKLMQNGLVSPSTLGINAGATSFVVCAIFMFSLSGAALFAPALIGGVTAIALTFSVSRMLRGHGDPRLNLVLSGSLIGTLFSALTTFVISLDPDSFSNLMGWLIGNIGNFDYVALAPMAPLGAIALCMAIFVSRATDILLLGQEQAAAIGVPVKLVYAATLATAIMLTVSAVTVVGPIGFVGLVVPHMVRLVWSETGLLALFLCFVGGAAILTGADILARVVLAPRLINVGTVMALAGGAIFLGLVLTRARGMVR